MKIRLEEIEQMISVILTKYREVNGNEIIIQSDYYWELDESEIYNVNEEPRDFSIGQISDDLDNLKKSFLSDDLVPYDLQRLAIILKTLSIEKPIYT